MSRIGTGSTTNLTNSTKFSLTAVENKSFADHDSLVHRLKLMKKLMDQLQHQRCMVQIIKESSSNHLQFKNHHTLHGFDSITKTVRQIRSKVKIPEKKSRRYDGDLLKMETPITSQLNLVNVVTHTLPETVYDRQNMSREKKISAKEQKEYSRSKFGEVPTRELRLQIIPGNNFKEMYQRGNSFVF